MIERVRPCHPSLVAALDEKVGTWPSGVSGVKPQNTSASHVTDVTNVVFTLLAFSSLHLVRERPTCGALAQYEPPWSRCPAPRRPEALRRHGVLNVLNLPRQVCSAVRSGLPLLVPFEPRLHVGLWSRWLHHTNQARCGASLNKMLLSRILCRHAGRLFSLIPILSI